VPNLEWSSILFYTTSGTFGKEDFTCRAEEFYLMDIGTPGYTEYEFGPDVVAHIMKNPELKKMKMGHIHSHNNMTVFFSGTDTDEIYTNSEHHNYYLSLIVNNNNDMTAKIAFRAVQKSLTLKFAGNGEEFKTIEHPKEEPTIFTYDCKIIMPGKIDLGDFDARIEELRDKASKKNIKKYSAGNSGYQYGGQSYKGVSTFPASDTRRDYQFVAKLLGLDMTSEKTVKETLEDLSESHADIGGRIEEYVEKVQKRRYDFCNRCFPEGAGKIAFADRKLQAVWDDVLDKYRGKYSDLMDVLEPIFKTESDIHDTESRGFHSRDWD